MSSFGVSLVVLNVNVLLSAEVDLVDARRELGARRDDAESTPTRP